MKNHFAAKHAQIWGAHASRVLASASRDRELLLPQATAITQCFEKPLFRRDAETNTRDACAPQNTSRI